MSPRIWPLWFRMSTKARCRIAGRPVRAAGPREKFHLGLFEHPYVTRSRLQKIVHSQEHQDLAFVAAREDSCC